MCLVFLNNYVGYFEYLGKHNQDRARPVYVIKCRLCPAGATTNLKSKPKPPKRDVVAKDVIIRCKDSSAFKRHLERAHPAVLHQLPTTASSSSMVHQQIMDSSVTSIGSGRGNSKDVVPYAKDNPIQVVFEKKVVEWVTDSSLPFNVVVYKDMFSHLDPRISVSSRSTIVRRIGTSYDLVIKHLKVCLREAVPGTLYLILVLWASKQMSVIGFKVRFHGSWNHFSVLTNPKYTVAETDQPFNSSLLADKTEAYQDLDLDSTYDDQLVAAITMWSTGAHRALRRNS
ncbi:unnamed protein product [Orchesella dallaii]|uniref:Uncharacterized protein n=1 Tax=Orchesella dallaii TaxID=48710 RepID=A0ABP1RQR0_9HEXA